VKYTPTGLTVSRGVASSPHIRHLAKVDDLRSLLTTEFGRQSVTRHWVLEGWKDLLGVRGASRRDELNSLSEVSVSYSIHYTRDGYENLANTIDGIIGTKERISAGKNNTGNTGNRGTFFWRGFTSPAGSARQRFSTTSYNANKRGRQHPHSGNGSNSRRRRN
jgi:hypothetical protein